MPTVLTHPAIPLAVRALTGRAVCSRRLVLLAALCSVVPDVDSLGFFAGIPYGSLLGHRGVTHSLAFALFLALCAMALAKRLDARSSWAFALVLLSTASHGILDALTDDGLGVAFLSPFSNRRFFFPWRPIPASPLGISGIFSAYGIRVLASEIVFIWLPCLLVVVAVRTAPGWAGRLARRSRRRPDGDSGGAKSIRPSAWVGTVVAIACAIAGASVAAVSSERYAHLQAPSQSREPMPGDYQAMLAASSENLDLQAEKLAARQGSSCPHDFSALETGRPLRISLFYGYDDHEGKVYDRVNAGAMLHILTSKCRGELHACGFSLVLRSPSAVTLVRNLQGRRVEANLFMTSLPDDVKESLSPVAAYREQDGLSRAVRHRFYRELVDSDVVFYMGHSRLGGGMGFDDQTGFATLVNAVSRLPMRPVLEALRQRPTKLRILGMFSCNSDYYFRQAFQDANPALSLILTTGDIRYGPAEQTSLGALEAVLSRHCGYAFRDSLISVDEPDPDMTYLSRGR